LKKFQQDFSCCEEGASPEVPHENKLQPIAGGVWAGRKAALIVPRLISRRHRAERFLLRRR